MALLVQVSRLYFAMRSRVLRAVHAIVMQVTFSAATLVTLQFTIMFELLELIFCNIVKLCCPLFITHTPFRIFHKLLQSVMNSLAGAKEPKPFWHVRMAICMMCSIIKACKVSKQLGGHWKTTSLQQTPCVKISSVAVNTLCSIAPSNFSVARSSACPIISVLVVNKYPLVAGPKGTCNTAQVQYPFPDTGLQE